MESSMRRLETIIQGLEDDKQSKIRADHYETTGHILMAHSYMGAPISDVVELDDVYNPGNTTQIKVKSGASYSENAQTYYQKAKNTRKTIEANKDRLVESRQKLHNVQSLIMSFEEVDGPRSLERWLKANDKHIGSLLPSQRSDAGTGRPWRTLQIGKYDVWIGKSASGDDELLQASHKEDIWMHARHVSGSHVVVRMNKSLDFPPNDVIETAASWAAWYSKAKTAGIAPVVYTKRKYVRKSKGAAPGAATVDKEQVCLVEPTKPPNSAAE
jgi:predicted ribosome quality control (RQC) complex YloA/Tae2 family protein